jgi:hypothetical protein
MGWHRLEHKLSARELDAEIRRLTAVVREGKATPEELGSGTFTLNNYGVFGVDGSAAIINHPEVAILGVGRIIDKPWVVGGELAVRKVTELTLTFDHRVCGGGLGGFGLGLVGPPLKQMLSGVQDPHGDGGCRGSRHDVGAAPACRSPREAGSAALLLPDGPIPRLRRDRFHFKGGF